MFLFVKNCLRGQSEEAARCNCTNYCTNIYQFMTQSKDFYLHDTAQCITDFIAADRDRKGTPAQLLPIYRGIEGAFKNWVCKSMFIGSLDRAENMISNMMLHSMQNSSNTCILDV